MMAKIKELTLHVPPDIVVRAGNMDTCKCCYYCKHWNESPSEPWGECLCRVGVSGNTLPDSVCGKYTYRGW
jgi:hypothetical protein